MDPRYNSETTRDLGIALRVLPVDLLAVEPDESPVFRIAFVAGIDRNRTRKGVGDGTRWLSVNQNLVILV